MLKTTTAWMNLKLLTLDGETCDPSSAHSASLCYRATENPKGDSDLSPLQPLSQSAWAWSRSPKSRQV